MNNRLLKKNRILLFVLWFILLTLLFFACDKPDESNENESSDDDNDDDDDDNNDNDDSPEHVWIDPDYGFMWQLTKIYMMDLHSAIDHCEQLVFMNYNDWRLPTINELRTLIRGCSKTITGGDCPVSESCNKVDECSDESCFGCGGEGGPGDEGCYWPYELSGYCSFYWSSTTAESDDYDYWIVFFGQGSISPWVWYNDDFFARCVRDK